MTLREICDQMGISVEQVLNAFGSYQVEMDSMRDMVTLRVELRLTSEQLARARYMSRAQYMSHYNPPPRVMKNAATTRAWCDEAEAVNAQVDIDALNRAWIDDVNGEDVPPDWKPVLEKIK